MFRNVLKRAISFLLAVTMVAGVMPANVQVFANSGATSGTNTNIISYKQYIATWDGSVVPAEGYEKISFAITPYYLGSDTSGNVLNKYLIGSGKTKNDLIYTVDVEEKGKWGYTTKDAKKVNGVYPSVFMY